MKSIDMAESCVQEQNSTRCSYGTYSKLNSHWNEGT